MTRHIVIHRDNPPPELASATRRWFTYDGEHFAVSYGGPGYGYEVFNADRVTIRDDYHTLDQVRREAAEDIDTWRAEQRPTGVKDS